MNTPVVSVLMTSYNRAQYIGAAIDSVLASSFVDFELIVVDDGSTDGTWEVISAHARNDARVQLHRNAVNLGEFPNRNRAAALARGAWLKYVDSDDVLYSHGLEVMVSAMRRFPAAGFGISRGPAPDFPAPAELAPAEVYGRHYLGGGMLGHGPLATIIRAEAFHRVGGFNDKRFIGDLDLWLRLAARHPVVLLPPGLTWWRQHSAQEFQLGQDLALYPRLSFEVNSAALTDPDCPLSARDRTRALRRVRGDHARDIIGLARRGRLRSALHLFRQSGLPMRALLGALRPA